MSTNKSTIVRIISKGAAIAPRLFEPALAELFLRAPARYRARPEEEAVLARAKRSWLPTDSGRARVYSWGTGPRVLLVHGHGGAAAQMTGFVEPLLSLGLSVVAFDAPGHGAAEGKRTALPLFARALGRVMLSTGPFEGVITHSLGGAALLLAAKEQRVQAKKAVLIAPPSDVMPWFERFIAYVEVAPDTAERVRGRIESHVGIGLSELKAAAMPRSLQGPMLVIHDQHDKEVPYESGREVVRHAERAELLTTTGLGHRRIVRDPVVIERAVAHVARGVLPQRSLEQVVNLELFDRERLQDPSSVLAW